MKEKDTVTVVVKTPWATTEEIRIIERITDTEIFVEHQEESPFNIKTGYRESFIPGTKVYIKELVK